MNCRAAQRLISAERDGGLSPTDRAVLEAHVAGCAECARTREALAAAADAWVRADRAVASPDVERAWADIRREIRSGSDAGSHLKAAWWKRAIWAGVPVMAAAAVAVAVLMDQPGRLDPGAGAASWTQYVQVETEGSVPVVTVDEASGWVVVWAGDTGGGHS